MEGRESRKEENPAWMKEFEFTECDDHMYQ